MRNPNSLAFFADFSDFQNFPKNSLLEVNFEENHDAKVAEIEQSAVLKHVNSLKN